MKKPVIVRPAEGVREKAVAEQFAENLKTVLREENRSLREFIDRGPTSGARKAGELLQGISLPSPGMVGRIAQWLKADSARLLQGIDTEFLELVF